MVVSLYNVRYRDVNYLVGIGLQLLFYATPIVYRLELIHNPSADALKRVINLNPMTHFVESIRRATYLQQTPSLYNWIGMVVPAALVLGLGWWLFSRKAPHFIEEI
jgi:ABC-type polysaccharide/polyol phosphate export permease